MTRKMFILKRLGRQGARSGWRTATRLMGRVEAIGNGGQMCTRVREVCTGKARSGLRRSGVRGKMRGYRADWGPAIALISKAGSPLLPSHALKLTTLALPCWIISNRPGAWGARLRQNVPDLAPRASLELQAGSRARDAVLSLTRFWINDA